MVFLCSNLHAAPVNGLCWFPSGGRRLQTQSFEEEKERLSGRIWQRLRWRILDFTPTTPNITTPPLRLWRHWRLPANHLLQPLRGSPPKTLYCCRGGTLLWTQCTGAWKMRLCFLEPLDPSAVLGLRARWSVRTGAVEKIKVQAGTDWHANKTDCLKEEVYSMLLDGPLIQIHGKVLQRVYPLTNEPRL